jgi:hypothetical protein
MLFFPPNWTPAMPHLALPTLTAYLRQHGVEVIQRDLNAEVFSHILTRDYLAASVARLRDLVASQRTGYRVPQPADRLHWALREGPRLAGEVGQAVRVMRSAAFFDGPVGLRAFGTVVDSLELASLPYYPSVLHLQSYVPAYPVDSSRALLHGVQDERTNMFLSIYRETVLEDIRREAPDVLGISIPSMAQMLPGMTLAYLVKHSGLDCHVTVGGPHISMLREQIAQTPALFKLIDSAVMFDGEAALLGLVEAVSEGRSLAAVPNLIWRNGETSQMNPRKEPEKIANLPLPDFDGLPLNDYLAPELALPLLTARGCYFGKCAFCNTGYGEQDGFSQLRAGHLAEQMLTLRERYGVRRIFFSDEAITPRNLRDLSSRLAALGAPVQWGGCARFEKVVSRELLESMVAGGCRMILFGLESASDPIMKAMVKGTEVAHMSRILQESATAGIWNHTFFFFGFPGETIADAQQTVNFLYAHQPYIHSAGLGTFMMERYSPAHRFPELYGVKRIVEDPDKDLAIYFEYEVERGMDEHMADLVESHFVNALPVKPYPQYYVSDVFRFLYACHLHDQGLPHPPWLAAEAAVAH